jgi:hypothetical protein
MSGPVLVLVDAGGSQSAMNAANNPPTQIVCNLVILASRGLHRYPETEAVGSLARSHADRQQEVDT